MFCSVPNFMCQGALDLDLSKGLSIHSLSGGDFVKGDGTGSFSIYGDRFPVSCALFPIPPWNLTPLNLRTKISKKNTLVLASCLWQVHRRSTKLHKLISQSAVRRIRARIQMDVR